MAQSPVATDAVRVLLSRQFFQRDSKFSRLSLRKFACQSREKHLVLVNGLLLESLERLIGELYVESGGVQRDNSAFSNESTIVPQTCHERIVAFRPLPVRKDHDRSEEFPVG